MDAAHSQCNIRHLINGGAKGADTLARQWAESRNIPQSVYYAEWTKYGNAAGHIRNQRMLDANPYIDYVIAFPGGRGTANMIAKAIEKGIPVLAPEDIDIY